MITFNIELTQGDTYQKLFRRGRKVDAGTPGAVEVEGTWVIPTDLTGMTARMHIRESVLDSHYVVELTTENGGIVIDDPTSGRFLINLKPESTRLLDRNMVWDLEFVDSLGNVKTYIGGQVLVRREVTHD